MNGDANVDQPHQYATETVATTVQAVYPFLELSLATKRRGLSMYIDADTHVDECEDTWSYIPKSLEHLRPGTMLFTEGQMPSYLPDGYNRVWFIDGQVFNRQFRSDERTGTSVESRELHDISKRLVDMDELGVDIHVIYPTLFLMEVTRRPELEKVLCESYNRWMADRCADSGGRLRWIAVAPYNSMPDALEEMRRAREAGAVGILRRGVDCGDKSADDPYFMPLYEVAQDLDMPVCFHTGFPYRGNSTIMTYFQKGFPPTPYVQNAFFAIVKAKIAQRFPTLKIGFIEAAAGWLPNVLWSVRAEDNRDFGGDAEKVLALARASNREMLAEQRLFVTCEVTEDLPFLVNELGDDNLFVASDYGHPDRASVWGAQQYVRDRTDISSSTAQKFVRDNAAAFYGLT